MAEAAEKRRQWVTGGVVKIEQAPTITKFGREVDVTFGSLVIDNKGNVYPYVDIQTQMDIEDMYVRFAMQNIDVETLVLTKEALSAYNKLCLSKERVILCDGSPEGVAQALKLLAAQ